MKVFGREEVEDSERRTISTEKVFEGRTTEPI